MHQSKNIAILNTTRKFSSAIIQRPSLVNVANDGRDAVAREDPAKLRPDLLFFGEIYRTCFEYIHIVDAAKFVVLFDFLVLILELDFFISKVGYFDVLHCLHLIWAVGSGLSAVIGFWQERFFLFWPLIALKATKFVLCLFTAVLLLILNLTYRRGLHKFIKWNYPRVEDTVTFSYLLFFLCLIFLTLDGLIFDLLYRVQIYFRRKAMAIYFMERQEILSIFV
uniref:Uncharacterized protein n=1 Tax=Panagrolaimus sp. PS1159 TaxID=55785 RepID=A0AC35GEW5_9BILA